MKWEGGDDIGCRVVVCWNDVLTESREACVCQ